MAQVADRGGDLPRCQVRELFVPELCRAAVGRFTQEHTPQRGFTAGDRTGDADDIAGVRRHGKPCKNRLVGVGEGEVFQRHVGGGWDLQRSQLLRQLHQRLDAPPGNFGFLDGVEELCNFR